jgi:hypothetical protein
MTEEQHQEALAEWLAVRRMQLEVENQRSVEEAIYAFSERDVLCGLSLDPEVAVRIWQVVEAARVHGFPEELRM